jgi:hypothetical protein
VKLRRLPDLSGQRFGRLFVAGRVTAPGAKHVRYDCSCDCGSITTVHASHLVSGRTESCGCLNSELAAARKLAHGDARKGRITPEYRAWQNMIARCENENDSRFERYGKRGIRVCDRWRASFSAFLEDMGRRPTVGHSLDRFPNNDGDYEPGNCRWATDQQQARNSSKAHPITIGNDTNCIAAWAERRAVSGGLVSTRLRRGWTASAALDTPPLENWDRRKGQRHG